MSEYFLKLDPYNFDTEEEYIKYIKEQQDDEQRNKDSINQLMF